MGMPNEASDEIMKMTMDKSYKPQDVLNRDPEIKAALDMLIDGSLADNEVEADVLSAIHRSLTEGDDPDRYFVLEDLREYYDTQKRAEELYQDSSKWAETVIHNMAAMGKFSSDVSIKNYADNIWGLQSCPIDAEELKRVQKEFNDSDRCFIA